MKCETFTAKNFCQHRHISVEFDEGLTAIIGANGSGKSNFLGGIRYALTGVNPNVGNKMDNVSVLSPPTETAFVELRFSHAGVRATVRRNFRPAKPTAVLTLDSGEVIEGDKSVTAKIEEILGITTDIVNDIVIVGQTDIFGFLDKIPSKRAEQFQRLFRTDAAGQAHKAINDHLKTLEIPNTAASVEHLQSLVSTYQQEYATAESGLNDLPSQERIVAEREANRQVVEQFLDLQRVGEKTRLIGEQIARVDAQIATLRPELQAATTQRDLVLAERDSVTDQVESARVVLTNLHQWKTTNAAKQAVMQQLSQLQAELTALTPPQEPQSGADAVALTDRLQTLQQEAATLRRFCDSFTDGVAACPTCGTDVTTLADKIDAARQQLTQVRAAITEAMAAVNAANQYVAAQSKYKYTQQSLTQQLQQAEAHLAGLPEAKDTEVDEESLRELLLRYDTSSKQVMAHNQFIETAAQQIATWQGQLTQLRDNEAELLQELARLPVFTKENFDTAKANITTWDQLEEQRRQAVQSVVTTSAALAQAEQHLEYAVKAAKEADVVRSWVGFVSAVQAVLHKDAAPRFVAQKNLQRLQVNINDCLTLFDAPYRVEADDGLSFIAKFTDGTKQPAERLSEGQKVILALSFRLSLNLLFADNIGALYLDEPTAYLDEHHIRGFEPVLSQLREFSASRGLQCFIVTHEKDLAPLFDRVVQL